MSDEHSTPDARAAAWRAFPKTVLHLAGASIDLREPVTPAVLARLAELGLREPFGVITAYNPLAGAAGAAPSIDDATRNSRLRATLVASGCRCWSVDACSPDGAHCEPSFAARSGRDALLSLARLYDQLAIFWFDGARFWIIPAQPGFEELALPA